MITNLNNCNGFDWDSAGGAIYQKLKPMTKTISNFCLE